MKRTFVQQILVAVFAVAGLLACKKTVDPLEPKPVPGQQQKNQIGFSLDSLPGLPKVAIANLFAEISITDSRNVEIVSKKKVTLQFNGEFQTEKLELPAGQYQLNRFLLITGTDSVVFATPFRNSVKSAGVVHPLVHTFEAKTHNQFIPLEVLAVGKTDSAESFGYPAGSFGNRNPGNTENKIQIRTAITIGNIVYDSIRSSLMLRSWNDRQEIKTAFLSMAEGINTITLDPLAVKYELTISKWGRDYQLILDKKDIRSDSVYVFGESRAPKLLSSEITSRLVNNNYVAESKTAYKYSGNKQLEHITYYRKRSDGSPYIYQQDDVKYRDGNVEQVSTTDENGQISASVLYTYDQQGAVSGFTQQANGMTTTGEVSYFFLNETFEKEVLIRYQYSNGNPAVEYYQRFLRGNIFSDNSRSVNGSTENCTYDYDQQINPYIHLGLPNIYLSNQSKNNITRQYKEYYGNYPEFVVYEFNYKYDQDGYPIELIRKYRSYKNNTHAFTTKTVFLY